LEASPEAYVETMVAVFREVRRVLRDDGTVWANLGDCYASIKSSGIWGGVDHGEHGEKAPHRNWRGNDRKPKDLVGIPWMVAFALRADGWYLRSEIVWAKPNPMPESVRDRPVCAHEKVFLLSKSRRYFYDAEAVKEPATCEGDERHLRTDKSKVNGGPQEDRGSRQRTGNPVHGRNLRNFWTIATEGFSAAHFATFPKKLVEPCILAGTPAKGCCPACGAPWVRTIAVVQPAGHKPRLDEKRFKCGSGGHPSSLRTKMGWHPSCDCAPAHTVPATVLDPFAGAGTTLLVAERLGRDSIGIEISPEYAAMAQARIRADLGTVSGGGEAEQDAGPLFSEAYR